MTAATDTCAGKTLVAILATAMMLAVMMLVAMVVMPTVLVILVMVVSMVISVLGLKLRQQTVVVMLTAVMRTRPLTGIVFGKHNSRNVVTQNDEKGFKTTAPRPAMLH